MPRDIHPIVAELISIRKELGLTQEQVARRVGWQRSQVNKYENGYRGMTLHSLDRYVEGLGGHLELHIVPD